MFDSPERKFVTPFVFGIPKCAWMRGRRRSQSRTSTSAPVCASIVAMLTAVVVLPSEGWLDVTSTVLGGCPAEESSSDVRRWRYASAAGERASSMRASAVVELSQAQLGDTLDVGLAAGAEVEGARRRLLLQRRVVPVLEAGEDLLRRLQQLLVEARELLVDLPDRGPLLRVGDQERTPLLLEVADLLAQPLDVLVRLHLRDRP